MKLATKEEIESERIELVEGVFYLPSDNKILKNGNILSKQECMEVFKEITSNSSNLITGKNYLEIIRKQHRAISFLLLCI